MKIKYKKSKQNHIFICSGLKKEGINRKELDTLYMPPEGLLRVGAYDDTKWTITYAVGSCIPLPLYYKQKCFTPDEILTIIKQFLDILAIMEEYRLTTQKLIIEFKYTFYNIDKRMLELVYCPVQNSYSPVESEQIFRFLRDIVTNAVVVKEYDEESDKIRELLMFFKQQQQFSAKVLSEFLNEDGERYGKERNYFEIPKPSVSKYPSVDTPFPSEDPSQRRQPFSYTVNAQSLPKQHPVDRMESNLSMDMQMQSFVAAAPSLVSSPQKKASVQQTSPTVVQNAAPSNEIFYASSTIEQPGDTVDAYDENPIGSLAIPQDTTDMIELVYLKNETTGVEYEIPCENCVIGREGVDAYGNPVVPDLIVTKNKRVGKRHAQISYDGTSYYIIDLASKNKTRVNNQVIESGIDPDTNAFNGKRTPIQNGTRIQLASEGFLFIVKEM